MELREIEIFLALAEELHFGRTAERLHVSQARISQTIKKLERQVGAPLFDRTSRRVAPTPIGARLRDDLAPAYRQIVGAVARATDAGRGTGGVLQVGFEAPGVADLIAGVLDTYRSRATEGEVEIREADFGDPFGLLRAGEVDVLVTLLPVAEPDLATGPVVLTEPMVLAVPARHPFARLDSVTLDDLARDTVFRAARPAPPCRRSRSCRSGTHRTCDGPWCGDARVGRHGCASSPSASGPRQARPAVPLGGSARSGGAAHRRAV